MPAVFRGDTRKGITGKDGGAKAESSKRLEVVYEVVRTRSGGETMMLFGSQHSLL
jgi:hypothetical protein